MPGVVRTRVGYCGGTTKNPTYTKIGDHTETIEIDYDPKKTSYEKLLAVFWSTHNPCATAFSRQYMTAVFYRNAKQRKLAEQTLAAEQKRRNQKINTKILPVTEFTLAEDYHQKYYLRARKELYNEFRAIYPSEKEFLNSTAVARVNSYVAGRGNAETLQKEIASYGLSEAAQKRLLSYAGIRR